MTRDGRTAYFTRVVSSPRSVDIYRAVRSAPGAFGDVVLVEETINSVADEILLFVSWDGCRLYFNRRTSGQTGSLLVSAKPAL